MTDDLTTSRALNRPVDGTAPQSEGVRGALPRPTPKEPGSVLRLLEEPEPPTAQCLACRSTRNHRLARWESMPLSILGLPRDAESARAAGNFTIDMRQCSACGHVFHAEFEYDRVPYEAGSNLMFNSGASWRRYQDDLAAEWVETYALFGALAVEIGCGEGLFLERLARRGVECMGFEPGPDAEVLRAKGIDVADRYFDGRALVDVEPDAIVCRHVLEHLPDPLGFLEDLAHAADSAGLEPLFLAEVPLIDKALEQQRLNDFLYEHVSNFTRRSVRTLFERAGWEVLDVRSRFADEVVTVVAKPAGRSIDAEVSDRAHDFRRSVATQTGRVRDQLAQWKAAGIHTALWGATGKGAAMINQFGIGPDLVELVIDSDRRKAIGYVPGTGQRIQPPEAIDADPVDRILICTNWRARDIEREIRAHLGDRCELWVYFGGELVELTPDLSI